MRRHPAIAWVLPFAIFITLIALQQIMPVPVWARLVLPLVAVIAFSREALRGGPSKPLQSVLIGIAVFVIWIGPDLITPSWHHFILFDNSVAGHQAGTTPLASKNDPLFLAVRVAVSVIAVPIIEELFWRGWMMRWLVESHKFEAVPLGTYAPAAFWVTALLFASEHGSFWDVGFAAGIVYNWWLIHTRNLWDTILAHAVTNGVLAFWVIHAGQWQYWL